MVMYKTANFKIPVQLHFCFVEGMLRYVEGMLRSNIYIYMDSFLKMS